MYQHFVNQSNDVGMARRELANRFVEGPETRCLKETKQMRKMAMAGRLEKQDV